MLISLVFYRRAERQVKYDEIRRKYGTYVISAQWIFFPSN